MERLLLTNQVGLSTKDRTVIQRLFYTILLDEGRPQFPLLSKYGIMKQRRNGTMCWFHVRSRIGEPLYDRWFMEVRHFHHNYAAVRWLDRWFYINPRGRHVNGWRFLLAGDVQADHTALVIHPREPMRLQRFNVATGRFI